MSARSDLDGASDTHAAAHRATTRTVADRREVRLGVKVVILLAVAFALIAFVAVDFLRTSIYWGD